MKYRKKKKKIEHIQIINEKIEPSPADHMIAYIKDPPKTLDLMNSARSQDIS